MRLDDEKNRSQSRSRAEETVCAIHLLSVPDGTPAEVAIDFIEEQLKDFHAGYSDPDCWDDEYSPS